MLEVLSACNLQGHTYCGLVLCSGLLLFSHYLTHFNGKAINFCLKNFPSKLSPFFFFFFIPFSRHSAGLFPDFYSLVYCHLPKNLIFSDACWLLIIFNLLPFPCFFILFVNVVMAGVIRTQSVTQLGNTLPFG